MTANRDDTNFDLFLDEPWTGAAGRPIIIG